MYDVHRFAAELLGVDQEDVRPSWELVGLMYRYIQLQHRALSVTLDRLQEHDPITGFTFAAEHPQMTDLLNLLTGVYAAVSTTDPRIMTIAKAHLDLLTPDPDQLSPWAWAYQQELEARRIGFCRL